MNPAKDIAGQVFNQWTVLERVESNAHGSACWLCRCTCGAEHVVTGHALRRGDSKSCKGCVHRDSRPVTERIAEKLIEGPVPAYNPSLGPCLLWTGARNPKGYGVIAVGGTSRSVHREWYIAQVGPVADDLELDHLCRVPACCNPKHLEPVTSKENQARAIRPTRPSKTHCSRGHALTHDNLVPDDLRRGLRRCWICKKDFAKKYYRNRTNVA